MLKNSLRQNASLTCICERISTVFQYLLCDIDD